MRRRPPLSVNSYVLLPLEVFQQLDLLVSVDEFYLDVKREPHVLLGRKGHRLEHVLYRLKVLRLIVLHFSNLLAHCKFGNLASFYHVKVISLELVPNKYSLGHHLLASCEHDVNEVHQAL